MSIGECELCGAYGPVVSLERDYLDDVISYMCWPHCDDDYCNDDDEPELAGPAEQGAA